MAASQKMTRNEQLEKLVIDLGRGLADEAELRRDVAAKLEALTRRVETLERKADRGKMVRTLAMPVHRKERKESVK